VAVRRVTGFSLTSTMRLAPCSSKWVKLVIGLVVPHWRELRGDWRTLDGLRTPYSTV
jgi:hypothetical protein